MIQIDHILISAEIIEKKFECHLNKCKGGCCWKGDFGAPLENEEIETIQQVLGKIKKYLPAANQRKIDKQGFCTHYPEGNFTGTQLMDDNQACVFMGFNESGIAQCMIEKAYLTGKIDFRKPISCHLYPVRIKSLNESGLEAMNYDKWEICRDACNLGEINQIPLYVFIKDAIIRKYGRDFYSRLNAIAKEKEDRNPESIAGSNV